MATETPTHGGSSQYCPREMSTASPIHVHSIAAPARRIGQNLARQGVHGKRAAAERVARSKPTRAAVCLGFLGSSERLRSYVVLAMVPALCDSGG